MAAVLQSLGRTIIAGIVSFAIAAGIADIVSCAHRRMASSAMPPVAGTVYTAHRRAAASIVVGIAQRSTLSPASSAVPVTAGTAQHHECAAPCSSQ